MKRFQFGLDGVLGYRQQVLEGRQNEYAKAVHQVQEQQSRLEAVQVKYQQMNAQFRKEAAQGMTAADAIGFENGLRVLEMEIARETATLQKLQREAEEKQNRVRQAHMDATVLERLKEKQQDAYRKEVQKNDERLIDELVSAERAVRRG